MIALRPPASLSRQWRQCLLQTHPLALGQAIRASQIIQNSKQQGCRSDADQKEVPLCQPTTGAE